jgi:large subunit ribosomal protein L16
MLQPKKQNYRKQFRGGAKTVSERGSELAFGEYGLKSQGRSWVSAVQLEAARRSIIFFTRKGGRVWTRVFPDKPISKKAAGTRMGGGKGDIAGYVVVVVPGKILFEIGGVTRELAKQAMTRAGEKLPIKTSFVSKEN